MNIALTKPVGLQFIISYRVLTKSSKFTYGPVKYKLTTPIIAQYDNNLTLSYRSMQIIQQPNIRIYNISYKTKTNLG